jgi:hypothetical protein
MAGLSVIVVGARTARQGIGEYVAAWFARHGARVAAVVGTTPATVAQARSALRERYDIDCGGYTDLDAALAEVPCDIAVLCSPYRVHAEQLLAVGRSGRHCLCEKPLVWPAPTGEDPIAPFVSSGRLLEVLTQWPCTLPASHELHPRAAGAAVEHFEMRLSPASSGLDMVPDAVPHFLSMIRALVGPGRASNLDAEFAAAEPRRLRLACDFVHARGRTRATLHLETCPRPPRPAWYSINGARVDREIENPGYRQFLGAGDRRIALEDPLGLLVGRFLANVAAKRHTDRGALDQDQELLTVFYGVAKAASSGLDTRVEDQH